MPKVGAKPSENNIHILDTIKQKVNIDLPRLLNNVYMYSNCPK